MRDEELLTLRDGASVRIRPFTGLVLAENAPMLALMAKLGAPKCSDVADGTVEASVGL